MLTTSYETYRGTQDGTEGKIQNKRELCGEIKRKQNHNTLILVLKYFLFFHLLLSLFKCIN